MNIASKLKRFVLHSSEPDLAEATAATKAQVSAAYDLLRRANEKAISLPHDIVAAIVKAHAAMNGSGKFNETQFWDAYAELQRRVCFAPRTRNRYMITLYGVLGALLLTQLFYLAGDHVRVKIADYDKRIADIEMDRSERTDKQERIAALKREQTAYCGLVKELLGIGATVTYPLFRPIGFHKFWGDDSTPRKAFASTERSEGALTERNESDLAEGNLIHRSKLDTMLLFFSGYLLPMLYGLLGACAFVLRKLCDEKKDKLAYAHPTRVHHSQRLSIGLLSGLAVGWFIKPGAGDPSLVSLSPLALAFIAGYGSDLFFVALDRIVQAFAPAPADSADQKAGNQGPAGQADRKGGRKEKPGRQSNGKPAAGLAPEIGPSVQPQTA
jgi:hypothetical protein